MTSADQDFPLARLMSLRLRLLAQARADLADAVARKLPRSTEMCREQVADLEEQIARSSRLAEAMENAQ